MLPSLLLMLSVSWVVLSFVSPVTSYVFSSSMPPRFQWVNNDGYCGEVSTIAAGLKYGQYFSQYDLRDIATGSQLTEYLVGVNDEAAAQKIGLVSTEFDWKENTGNTENYLAWIKKMTRKGYAVTMTVYMNYYLFYGISLPTAGDAEYDHIVSVSSIESNYDDDLYHDNDILIFSDHGLWSPRVTGPVYLFNSSFQSIIGTREQSNSKTGTVYTLPLSSKTTCSNYGIAHSGVIDSNGDTVPVHITTSVNFESPEIVNKSEKRPEAMKLELQMTISGLQQGVQYNIYRYDDERNVPTSKFNGHYSQSVEKMEIVCCNSTFGTSFGTIHGVGFQNDIHSFIFNRSIQSSDKVIYRVVPASAP